jgi:(p)ppGpp synthase/HD superfamily hydrolase
MRYSSRIDEAIKLASTLHRHQVRNDMNKTPYISHLVSVASLVSLATDDEDSIIAGLLHDTLEDVPGYHYDDLVRAQGERVANIVYHVTEPLNPDKTANEQLPWLTRKEEYLKRLREGGVESAIVSCADKIHNTKSFLDDVQKEGGLFVSRFTSSVRNRLWFHQEVLAIVEEKLTKDHVLSKLLREVTDEFGRVADMLEQ